MAPPEISASAARDYRQRLVVYVAWHPDFAPGAELARRLYDHLTRDSQQPIARGLGIPVYFRSAPAAPGSEAPAPIPLDEAHNTAVVVFVDDTMVLSGDQGWSDYLAELHGRIASAEGGQLMLPVMFSGRAFAVAPGVDAANFLRPRSGDPGSWAETLVGGRSAHYPLFNMIVHELCRLLLEVRRIDHDDEGFGGRLERRVKVFINHAKKDGRAIARPSASTSIRTCSSRPSSTQ